MGQGVGAAVGISVGDKVGVNVASTDVFLFVVCTFVGLSSMRR